MQRYLERKFALTLLIVITATALCALGMLDGGQWVTACCGALTVFAAGDVGQQWVSGAPADGNAGPDGR